MILIKFVQQNKYFVNFSLVVTPKSTLMRMNFIINENQAEDLIWSTFIVSNEICFVLILECNF